LRSGFKARFGVPPGEVRRDKPAYQTLLRAKERLALGDEVRLAYYRLSKTYGGNTSLTPGDTAPVGDPTAVGTGRPTEPDQARLSEIVPVLNERFGTDFGPGDQLWFDQVVTDMAEDEELGDQARSNAIDQFKIAFGPKAMEAVVGRMDRNEHIASQFLTDERLREVALELMMQEVYRRLRGAAEAAR
jgi:type I restriction enzyme R subunit